MKTPYPDRHGRLVFHTTLQDAAELLNYTESYVAKIERGAPNDMPLSTLIWICEQYGTKPSKILKNIGL